MFQSNFLCLVGLRRFFVVPRSCFPGSVKPLILAGAALLSTLMAPFASAADVARPQVLHAHVPRDPPGTFPRWAGSLPATKCSWPSVCRCAIANSSPVHLPAGIYDPSSPNFRHFLKPGEFAASFGPSAEDYQSVIDFAKAHHLKIVRTHSNRTLVDVSGSVADVENAFHVHLRTFKHPKENRIFFAPDAEPSLDLKTPVLAISGLDNYTRPKPRIHPSGTYLRPDVRPLGVLPRRRRWWRGRGRQQRPVRRL